MSGDNTHDTARIVCVDDLLDWNLYIPVYQRPYKWTERNISELIEDLIGAIEQKQKERIGEDSYRYRIGSVILLDKKNGEYEIVDGQQRIITLGLIRKILEDFISDNASDNPYRASDIIKWQAGEPDKVTQQNFRKNCQFIYQKLKSINSDLQPALRSSLKTLFECVVFTVQDSREAFQLFDSQNTRGKKLNPHDLLKAYHLREMKNERPFEKSQLINRWESIEPERMSKLFSHYLYPILCWSRREKTHSFSERDIDFYKGVRAEDGYTFGDRVTRSMPVYQIDEPIESGSDFFRMTIYYSGLVNGLRDELKKGGDGLKRVNQLIENREYRSKPGFNYACDLFFCVLLFYYDHFHSLREEAVIQLFTWAMIIRIDMENLSLGTINLYAIGDDNNRYSNHIPMFYLIGKAMKESEILNCRIQRPLNPKKVQKWNELFEFLKEHSAPMEEDDNGK